MASELNRKFLSQATCTEVKELHCPVLEQWEQRIGACVTERAVPTQVKLYRLVKVAAEDLPSAWTKAHISEAHSEANHAAALVLRLHLGLEA